MRMMPYLSIYCVHHSRHNTNSFLLNEPECLHSCDTRKKKTEMKIKKMKYCIHGSTNRSGVVIIIVPTSCMAIEGASDTVEYKDADLSVRGGEPHTSTPPTIFCFYLYKAYTLLSSALYNRATYIHSHR